LKGVDELWQHEGNVFRIGPYDFPEDTRERNWSIYNMRVVEKRTLAFIAEKYGISRERVRQIVFKGDRVMRVRKWVRGENKKKAGMAMGALRLSTRARNVLTNELGYEWVETPILLFIGAYKPDELLRAKGAGRKTFLELHEKIRKVDADVADIWTSGHGENYNPAKHGRRRPVIRNITQQDRISRLHEKSGKRGKGAGGRAV
jgi:hypothetical protein